MSVCYSTALFSSLPDPGALAVPVGDRRGNPQATPCREDAAGGGADPDGMPDRGAGLRCRLAADCRAGMLETEAAVHFRALLSTAGTGFEGVERADGFAWCMSGPNAAFVQGAYARSRARPIGHDDMVLVHCNSYADGYWVDVTRTYMVGEPNECYRAMDEAVFVACAAALAAIRPGGKGRRYRSGHL